MERNDNKEIERKFEIEYPTEAEIAEMMRTGAVRKEITQIYLNSPNGNSRRIRRSESDGRVTYKYTEKRGRGLIRYEHEIEITEAEYERLKSEAEIGLHPVVKTRLCVPSDGRVIEIDLYNGFTDYAVAEVELATADEKLPDMSAVRIIREVTGEYRWLNRAIAADGMPEK